MNEKIIIHHIEVSKTSLNISGGERALIEIVDYFDKKGFENIIYTSESGKIVYNCSKNFNNVSYVEIGPIKYEKINGYFAYYLRFFQLFFKIRKFNKNYENIILTHEDFLPSTIFSFFLKIINPNAKWFMIYHMKCPDLFKGYKGEFTSKFHIPDLRLFRYWLEQRITFLISKKVEKIITVNSYYIPHLSKFYSPDKIFALESFGGLYHKIEKKEKYSKMYDLIFVGRFHAQKGIFDIIKIINNIKNVMPNINIVVLGGGNKSYEKQFIASIKRNNLERNIIYKGFVSDDYEKNKYLQESKIFLMPSYYESYGLVILEAFHFGLPVISYDLPIYSMFNENLIKVKIGDVNGMSNTIIEYLNDKTKYNFLSGNVFEFSKRFSWTKTGDEFNNFIQKELI